MTILLGDWLFDPSARCLSRGGEVRRLSPKAAQVLELLLAAEGAVVTRDKILEQVWVGVTVGEEVLTQAVAELRRALGDDFRQPRYIETLHKSGYRLLSGRPAVASETAPKAGFRIETYARYLDGCDLFYRGGQANVARAASIFSDLVANDSRHALAYAGLAKSTFFMDRYFGLPGDNSERVAGCGQKALELAPETSEAQAAWGLSLAALGRFDDAMARFSTAIALNRDDGEAHYLLGRACFADGRFRTAAAVLERAAKLRADDFHSLFLAAKARRFTGDSEGFHANLVKADQRIGAWLAAYPDDRRALSVQVCCRIELADVRSAVETALQLSCEPDPNQYYLVGGLVRAGETAVAIDVLEAAFDAGWSDPAWLSHDHDLDPLIHEPRFQSLTAGLRAH